MEKYCGQTMKEAAEKRKVLSNYNISYNFSLTQDYLGQVDTINHQITQLQTFIICDIP